MCGFDDFTQRGGGDELLYDRGNTSRQCSYASVKWTTHTNQVCIRGTLNTRSGLASLQTHIPLYTYTYLALGTDDHGLQHALKVVDHDAIMT